jgi:hypothetical protein
MTELKLLYADYNNSVQTLKLMHWEERRKLYHEKYNKKGELK